MIEATLPEPTVRPPSRIAKPRPCSVNGITADWEAEKAYWAFYIGEEYAQTGVDATDIVADTEYSFVKTISE